MLPDIGASELMVIALVALIFVGPKDLPVMLKKLGQFTAKLRSMATDFRASFDDMARQSELDDLRREVEQMRASASEALTDPGDIGATFSEAFEVSDYAAAEPAYPAIEEAAPTPKPRAAKAPAVKKATTAKSPAAKAKAAPVKKSPASTPAAKSKPVAARSSAAPTRKRAPKVVS